MLHFSGEVRLPYDGTVDEQNGNSRKNYKAFQDHIGIEVFGETFYDINDIFKPLLYDRNLHLIRHPRGYEESVRLDC